MEGRRRPSPCASCKLRRRRCADDCIFAPYFPSDDPQKYSVVHKVFGASHVSKLLQEVPVDQRADAVSSLVYEANARMEDPVYGCAGVISLLNSRVSELEAVKGGKGKEAFETAQEKGPSVFAAAVGERKHEAAEKRILNFPLDLNELPSDEDEAIMP